MLISMADSKEQKVLLAIQENPLLLDNYEKTPERCMVAVKSKGHSLKFIPKSMQTYKMCLAAVRNDGNAIRFASKKLLTDELCYEAIKQNGFALEYVPDKFKTNDLCVNAVLQVANNYEKVRSHVKNVFELVPSMYLSKKLYQIAIKRNGIMLQYVPDNKKDDKMCVLALTNNSSAFEYVPTKLQTKQMCVDAVKLNPLMLQFVCSKYKSITLCNTAIELDWRAFAFTKPRIYTKENCIDILERAVDELQGQQVLDSYKINQDYYLVKTIAKQIPLPICNEPEIVELERRLFIRRFTKAWYDKATDMFFTQEEVPYSDKNEEREFVSFAEFYQHLGSNLNKANLLDYDFAGIDLNDYNIIGAAISGEILAKNGLYDDTFYKNNVALVGDDNSDILLLSAENENVTPAMILHETDLDFSGYDADLWDNSLRVYYISDIHLNYKLQKAFPKYATAKEAECYIQQLVWKMTENIDVRARRSSYLLIAGDISSSLSVSQLFYSALIKRWEREKIIVVLGNHELWACDAELQKSQANNVDEVVSQYQEMSKTLGITFLYNDLLVLRNVTAHYKKATVIPEDKLRDINIDALSKECSNSSLVIMGGVGFSGLNQEFNASNRIYRNTVTSIKDDISHTKRFEYIYKKLKQAAGNERIIILTHTPKENWSEEEYQPGWIYVNGHTHRNEYYCSYEKTVYADNQIGYSNTSIGLKHFCLSGNYDIFKNYLDDIYEITREQYIDFNRGQNITMTFNRTGKIHMLKNQNIYCFIYEDPRTQKLYLLNGGAIKCLDHKDLSYYYEMLPYYSVAIKSMLSGYNQALKFVANAVKKIGGFGTVHGCIVDIDTFNHIYLNPLDGSITPYYALSIVEKYFYDNVDILLEKHRPDLLSNYIKYLESSHEAKPLLEGKKSASAVDISRFVSETCMYEPSRIMKQLQHLTEANVVRIWDDRVIKFQEQTSHKLSANQQLLSACYITNNENYD